MSILLLLLLLLPSYSVQEEQCREVRGVERMKEVDKLGTVDCIDGRESATGEDAQLKKLSDGSILEHLYT